jgi:hypothetical protein
MLLSPCALATRDLRDLLFPPFDHDVTDQKHGGQANPESQKDFGSFAARPFPAPGQDAPEGQDGQQGPQKNFHDPSNPVEFMANFKYIEPKLSRSLGVFRKNETQKIS